MIAVRLTGDDSKAWFELIKLGPAHCLHCLPGKIYLISEKQLEALETLNCSFEKVKLAEADRIIKEKSERRQLGGSVLW